MFDLAFRERFSTQADGIVQALHRRGLSADMMTLLGLLLGLCAALCASQGLMMAAVVVWWLSRFFDGLDGLLARYAGTASPAGAFFDLTADMVAYGGMVVAFSVVYPNHALGWNGILYGYLLVAVTALALGSQEEKAGLPNQEARSLRLGVGLAEAGETGCVYTLFCLLPEHIGVLQAVWLSMLFLTVVVRCYQSRRMKKLTQAVH